MIKIAFTGNPNVGKTALINSIAGSNLKVGNWPGVTVEKKEAEFMLGDEKIQLIDLPGVYSLASHTVEERITRDFILNENPDIIINVVDSTNLERNLYLTSLLKEIGKPILVALNYFDEFEKLGYTFDNKKFMDYTGLETIETVAVKKRGQKELIEKAVELVKERKGADYKLKYSKSIQQEIECVKSKIIGDEKYKQIINAYSPNYIAIKLIEKDSYFIESVNIRFGINLEDFAKDNKDRLESEMAEDIETIFAEHRYGVIKSVLEVTLKMTMKSRLEFTHKVDKFLLNRVLGGVIFLFMMYVVFLVTFNGSAPFIDWIDGFINGYIGKYAGYLIEGTPDWMTSLVLDGIIGGVGGVLSFVPLMVFLFFFLALLEESGYMSRAAFLMDKLMRSIGLNGKAFLPLLLGFGCSVPSIYATRTLEDEKSRKITALISPLMSCGARLPVYALFTAAFFPGNMPFVVMTLYFAGVVTAVAIAFVLKKLKYFGKSEEMFLIELPPYRMPTAKMIWNSMWHRTKEYVQKAGTVILGVLIILWALTYFPAAGDAEKSFIGRGAKVIQPIFQPTGFGDSWEAVASIFPGIVAKEVVVGYLAQTIGKETETEEEVVYDFATDSKNEIIGLATAIKSSVESIVKFKVEGFELEGAEDSFNNKLREKFTPLSAYSFMIFVLLVIPCVATLGVIKQEFGWKMMFIEIVILSVVPWIASTAVYQIGSILIK
jgi:ferrous iron transport protein B